MELKKIINVLSVHLCKKEDYLVTEMALIKISKDNQEFKAFVKEMKLFQARVLYSHDDIEVFEFSGKRSRVNQFIDVGLAHNAQSVVRTGSLAMPKAINVITDAKQGA